ncbi:hypothetical protein LA59_24980 [Vibrio harveyi]|uniref:Uncharacterized protein n=2 Tax=Vibrionaceae TaxID=641 RepID=A0A1E3E205_VIBHA|nr:hypothetical protein LA59_24980 [Vibrio harveyi]EMR37511.1 hypothetical protein MUQ_08063 [Vibrio harveyi CAIM 1792]AMG00554.1 hypothetical protein AL538_23020 [Vibrio harveyi]APP08029.1 hypothetical protein BG259_22455 [Vibrio harveyi]AWB01964.1 hypothetical protein CU052_22360 [Vibrio harveyi]
MKEKPKKCGEVTMTTQEFYELRKKINELTASQLKSLQGEINLSLNKKESPLLSSEERDMLSKLFA